MSLLNQMLRDLDQHQPSTPPSSLQEAVVKVPTKDKNFNTRLLLAFLFLTALVSYFLINKQETNLQIISQPLAIPDKKVQISLPAPAQQTPVLREETHRPPKNLNKSIIKLSKSNPASKQILSSPDKDKVLTPLNIPSTKKSNNSIQPAPLSNSQQAKLYYQQALQTTNKLKAITLLNKSILLNPKHSKSRLLLAQRLINTGDQQSAINVLDSSLKDFPDNPSFIMVRAQLYLQEKNTNSALELLTKVPAPLQNEAYLSLLAAAYQQNKSYSQSIIYYQTLVKLNSSKAEYWLGLGLAHDALKHSQQAYNAYHQALALNKLNTAITSYIHQRLKQLP